MRKVNLQHLPEEEWRSPSGKYHAFDQEVSVALGREPKSLDLTKRHPFDLSRVRLPPAPPFAPTTRTRLNGSFT